jgi:hypothetical protein
VEAVHFYGVWVDAVLDFLTVPKECWTGVLMDVVKASVKAFYALDRVWSIAQTSDSTSDAVTKHKSLHGISDTNDPGKDMKPKETTVSRPLDSDENTDGILRRWNFMETDGKVYAGKVLSLGYDPTSDVDHWILGKTQGRGPGSEGGSSE